MKKFQKMFAVLTVLIAALVSNANAQMQWTTPVSLTNQQSYDEQEYSPQGYYSSSNAGYYSPQQTRPLYRPRRVIPL